MSFVDRWLSRTQRKHHTGSSMVNTGANYSTRRLSTRSTGSGVEYVVEDVKTTPNLLNTPVSYYKQTVAKGNIKADPGQMKPDDLIKQVESDLGNSAKMPDQVDLSKFDFANNERKGSVGSETSNN